MSTAPVERSFSQNKIWTIKCIKAESKRILFNIQHKIAFLILSATTHKDTATEDPEQTEIFLDNKSQKNQLQFRHCIKL